MDKVVESAAEAVADIGRRRERRRRRLRPQRHPVDPHRRAARPGRDGDLTVVSNNCGVDGAGLGLLLGEHRISRVIASYVGENKEFARQFLAGEVEVQLTPQGTLAEKLRAGGAGIPAFYTPTGVGTPVADGGLPWRYGPDGDVVLASPPKEVRTFGGRECVLEESITTDFALVRAADGDRHGNLVFHRRPATSTRSSRWRAAVTIAEVEELVDPGGIDPDDVHVPGMFVQRVVAPHPGAGGRQADRAGRSAPAAVRRARRTTEA